MRINNMLPVTLIAASLFMASSLYAQTSTSTSKFKPKPTYTAHLSVGQVFFGTGDINGYGLLVAVEKSVFKKSVRPFPAFQVGFGIDKSFLPASATHGWPFYDAVSDGGANVGWTWPYDGY